MIVMKALTSLALALALPCAIHHGEVCTSLVVQQRFHYVHMLYRLVARCLLLGIVEGTQTGQVDGIHFRVSLHRA